MTQSEFRNKVRELATRHDRLLRRKNAKAESGSGVFDRYAYPVLTAEHTPLFWRYDFDQSTNPSLMERMGINATFNAGAIEHDGKILVVARVEGVDRKSFLAVAESKNGVDNFRFWDYPILMPETDDPDINVYDIRLVRHEDGWIYGLFCTERKDPKAPSWDTSSAGAQCGIARTKDLKNWERLPDLKTKSPQQRNVVLHPEFVDGKYAFYTRPQDEFIQAGKGGGIGWGLSSSMENAVVEERNYHRQSRVPHHQGSKERPGTGPDQDREGLAASGARGQKYGRRARYVLYMFLANWNVRRSSRTGPPVTSSRRRKTSALAMFRTWSSAMAGSSERMATFSFITRRRTLGCTSQPARWRSLWIMHCIRQKIPCAAMPALRSAMS